MGRILFFSNCFPSAINPTGGTFNRCLMGALAQKHRVQKMRDKLTEALSLSQPPDARAMLDCIVAGIAHMDQDVHAPRAESMQSGSVDLF